MIRYLLRRLAIAPLVLLVLATVTFALVRAAPGGPFSEDRKLDPAVVAALEAKVGLDRPLPEQWWRTLRGIADGSLPSTKVPGQTVGEIITARLPTSLLLGGLALAVAVLGGLALALVGAMRPGGWLDRATGSAAMALVAVPSFVIGPVLALVLGLWLHLLPVAGWAGVLTWLMPVATLAAAPAARIARLGRAALAEVAGSDHVRTARAKGVSEWRTLLVHQLSGALLPVIAYLGPAAAYLLTGSVVVEAVFQVPGLGSEFVQAALNRDHNLVMALTVVYGGMVIGCSLAADLVIAALDPRVRLR